MSRLNCVIYLLIAMCVSSCATLDDFAMPALKSQAATDMGCSADQLKVSETEQWHYAVDGCNKHTVYVMEMCNKITRNCVFITEAQYVASKSVAPQAQTPQSKDAQKAERDRQAARQKEFEIARQKDLDKQRKQAGESDAQFRQRLDNQRRDWDRQDQQRRDEDRRRQQQLDDQRRQDQARQDQQRRDEDRRRQQQLDDQRRQDQARQQQYRRY